MIAINAAATDRNAVILSEIQDLEFWKTVGQETISGARPVAKRADGTECEPETYTRWVTKAEIFIPILQAALEPACALEPPPADLLTERITELEGHLKHLNWLILAMLGENDADRAWSQAEGTPEVGARYQDWLRSRAQLLSHARAYQLAHPR